MSVMVRWWDGILARSLMAVVGISLLMGGAASIIAGQMVGERVYARATQKLGELLDTVESTVSVACFTGDEQLANELAQGLLRNSEVEHVVIRVGEKEVAHQSRYGRHDLAHGTSHAPVVKRAIRSPFKADEVIGEVMLEIDEAAIDAQVRETVRFARMLLAAFLLLVIAAAAAAMLYLVVRPIKATSDRMHRLDVASGKQLRVPEGHERTEVGRLVDDINQLTGRLVATLEQERDLRRRQEVDQRKYRNLFDNAGSGIFVADRDGNLDSFNRAFAALTWQPLASGEGPPRLTDMGWQAPGPVLAMLRDSLADPAGGVREDDFLLEGRRGDKRWLHVAMVPLGDGSVQGTVTDVTLRKREELSARRLAVTDSLTGLANREGLNRKLADLDPAAPHFALVRIDLDGFKQVTDAMGFPVGDRLLLDVAGRLREALTTADFVARIGGAEFALLLGGEQAREALARRLDVLAERLVQPYRSRDDELGAPLTLGARIGVALFPADGIELQQLLRRAELALNSVPAGSRACRFFDPAQQAAVEHRRRLEDDLRAATTTRELQLFCQPIIDLRLGRVTGGEALLRWPHPQQGQVSPEVFVPLAEEVGLIGEIGRWVLEEACRSVAAWRAAGLDLYVSVNVSVRQIPVELPAAAVLEALARHGLPPEAIVIEITEGVLMSDVAVAQQWIAGLRAAGLRVYLDDFGTGYSSLSYLKRFPLDTVKIDKSFIRDMHADNSDYALVDAIITMAESLGLNVVAEGIEDEYQLRLLHQMGCGHGQGYHFSRPVALADFAATVLRIDAELAVADRPA